jgi:hypothetical protein
MQPFTFTFELQTYVRYMTVADRVEQHFSPA